DEPVEHRIAELRPPLGLERTLAEHIAVCAVEGRRRRLRLDVIGADRATGEHRQRGESEAVRDRTRWQTLAIGDSGSRRARSELFCDLHSHRPHLSRDVDSKAGQAGPASGSGGARSGSEAAGVSVAGEGLRSTRRTIQYDTGVSSSPNRVTPIIPENTATPIACRISAPEPVENTSGTTPAVNAIDVIRIGRRRRRHASMIASHVL